MDDRPIGMFDSGFGGLTVARATIDLMPKEDLVYLGDTARYPYGPRPQGEVEEFSLEIGRYLVDRFDIKVLVVACNTATAAAIDTLRAELTVPVLGVIEPGVRALLDVTESDRIGVIGTVGTIGSGTYQGEIAAAAPNVEVICCACPGLVEFVERGSLEGAEVRLLADRLLAPILEANIDALLLGCTHYPYLARVISDVVGRGVVLVSSADETAFALLRLLEAEGLQNRGRELPVRQRFVSSGDIRAFTDLGSRLLGPELVDAELWKPGSP